MFLTGFYRKARIKSQLAELNMKLMTLHDKQKELAQYASNIADGIITPEEMATSSSRIYGKHMSYMMRNVPMAMLQGQQAFQMYGPQYMAQLQAVQQEPTMAGMMQTNPMMLQMQFFKQALERQGKIEEKKIHIEEKKIQQDIDKVQGRMKMLEAELSSLDKVIDESIRKSAPKYVVA